MIVRWIMPNAQHIQRQGRESGDKCPRTSVRWGYAAAENGTHRKNEKVKAMLEGLPRGDHRRVV